MKVNHYLCDRCGEKFEEKHELQGVSPRCVERTWDICPACLRIFIDWMDELKKGKKNET